MFPFVIYHKKFAFIYLIPYLFDALELLICIFDFVNVWYIDFRDANDVFFILVLVKEMVRYFILQKKNGPMLRLPLKRENSKVHQSMQNFVSVYLLTIIMEMAITQPVTATFQQSDQELKRMIPLQQLPNKLYLGDHRY